MSVENLNNGGDAAVAEQLAQTAMGDDQDLSAVWDQLQSDDTADGDNGDAGAAADLGEGDVKLNPDDPTPEGEGTGEEGAEDGSSTLTDSGVPLPANWNGMDEDWKKIPPDVQAKIAARDQEIHVRMSDQGRQISAYKPVNDVFEQNKDLLEGRQTPDGRPVTPAFAAQFLLEAQRRIDANPIGSLIEMAERFGLRNELQAALNGQLQFQRIQPPAAGQPQNLSAADVAEIVKSTLTEDTSSRAAAEEVSRLSADKPLYSKIAEGDMVHSIHKARTKLGDAASNEAVFNLAYDMAVNADPDLRAEAAAAAKTAAAAVSDTKKIANAKRASSINVTSNSSGRSRELTEDELLAATYDEVQSKG